MIKFPKLFENVLASDPALNAAVRQSFGLFEPWLSQSGMPFFPGFTDHSPRHIGDVLDTAASLISDAGHDLLVAEDVAVLCIATLLHDCGMHLTPDGFRELIEDASPPLVSGFNDQPWAQLWKDYLAEARRFGQEKLVAIFGDSEPIRTDEIDYENLSERNFLLIGEFVRRHHARLAHEIAIKGVPSRATEKLTLVGFDDALRDITGLVARSHGMSIRSTFGYLEERYGLIPEQRRIKSPFLMAVLRIADYVQVQSERAIRSLLSVKELRSPISRQEWRNHFAVKNVSQWHDDPEAFFVDAAPTDAKTYLKLVKLFADIQRELDKSWATLGEVYGRRGALAKLGLTMRRIRSNLDSPEKFARTVPYIPIKAGFDSSGPDLLKLLVGPLYDYGYEIGVRELIQNAVDACRELSDIQDDGSVTNRASEAPPTVVVAIDENDDGTGWITVTDTGVGMTLDTVTKYFLIAGASFRNSDLWKRQHIDESGQTKVMRGGRFGVGALAAFLLGEELQVRTRHFERPESDGFEFRARIDDPEVEIRRCMAPQGTSIKIWISDTKIMDSLRPHMGSQAAGQSETGPLLESWSKIDWFVQSSPSVECRWNGFDRPTHSKTDRVRFTARFLPKKEDCVPIAGTTDPNWERLTDPSPYNDIYWRYTPPIKRSSGTSTWTAYQNDEVIVNGIRVQKLGDYAPDQSARIRLSKEHLEACPYFVIRRPSLAIFDPAGICPINLQRSSVAFERMGIDLALARSVLNLHLRNLISKARTSQTIGQFQKRSIKLADSRDVRYAGIVSSICATSDGICLATPIAFSKLKIETLYFVASSDISVPDTKLSDFLRPGEALIFRHAAPGSQNDLAWFRATTPANAVDSWYSNEAGFPPMQKMATLAMLPVVKWHHANEKGRVNQHLLRSLRSSPIGSDYMRVESGNASSASAMEPRCAKLLTILGNGSELAGWFLTADQPNANAKSLLIETWLQITDGAFLVEYEPNMDEQESRTKDTV